jgi:hypothetical protein
MFARAISTDEFKLADVGANRVVFADHFGEPVGGLNRLERAVDVDLLHLVDRYDGRVAITGGVARRHGEAMR